MKLLLTMNLPYLRSYGGANRSNRLLAESLAARGHEVLIVVPALSTPSLITHEQFLSGLRERNIPYVSQTEHERFSVAGVDVIAVRDPSRLRSSLLDSIKSYEPDWILVSSEDQSQNLLGAALSIRPAKAIYLAHTPQMFPFGPASLYPGEARTEYVRQAAGVIAISRFVASYITHWTGCDVFVNHPPHYGHPPFPDYGAQPSGHVVVLNACAVKGICVLLSLATVMPHVRFAAVPGWGTTQADLAAIANCPNITLLNNATNLDDILQKTRLLLMPSLWLEGFGMSVVDAMLRGIPVLASNSGGLPEAKLGTDFIFEVSPITHFSQAMDSALLPVPIVPPQDIDPWCRTIDTLLSDRQLYRKHSLHAREVSTDFVASLSCLPLENYLLELGSRRSGRNGRPSQHKHLTAATGESVSKAISKQIQQLSPEQRALLILRRAEKRKSQSVQACEAPQGEIETRIALVWAELLKVPLSRIGRHDDFFALGGDPHLAMQAIGILEQQNIIITPHDFFAHPTLHGLTTNLDSKDRQLTGDSAVCVRRGTEGPPLFITHQITRNLIFQALTPHIAATIPVFAMPVDLSPNSSFGSVEQKASHMLQMIRKVQPAGPYRLLGYSYGGLYAYEIARQLFAGGEHVAFVGLIDTLYKPLLCKPAAGPFDAKAAFLEEIQRHLHSQPSANGAGPVASDGLGKLAGWNNRQFDDLVEACRESSLLPTPFLGLTAAQIYDRLATGHAKLTAWIEYEAKPVPVPIHLFVTPNASGQVSSRGWDRVAEKCQIKLVPVAGSHQSLMSSPFVDALGDSLSRAISHSSHL